MSSPNDSASQDKLRLWYRAIYNYEGDSLSAHELPFKAGDIILIVSKDPSGWWDGVIGDNRGWVPSNYLMPLPQPSDQPSTESPQPPQHTLYRALYSYEGYEGKPGEWDLTFKTYDIIEVVHKRSDGWWFGMLGDERGWVPSNHLVESSSSALGAEDTTGNYPAQYKELVPSLWCRALYDYNARDLNSRDLSFKTDDIIKIVYQREDGWWDGVLGDKKGWVPSNYVEIISAREAKAARTRL